MAQPPKFERRDALCLDRILLESDERTHAFSLPKRSLVGIGPTSARTAIPDGDEFAACFAGGAARPSRWRRIVFECSGTRRVTVEALPRQGKSRWLVDGEAIDAELGFRTRRLTGGDRDAFLSTHIIDSRTLTPAGGEAALKRALETRLLGARAESVRDADQKLAAIAARRRALDGERKVRAESSPPSTRAEPESLGEILEALEAERAFVRDLVVRHVAVADTIERGGSKPAGPLGLGPIVDELEKQVVALEGLKTRWDVLKRDALGGADFLTTLALVTGFGSSGGIAGTGWWLGDGVLLRLGFYLVAACAAATLALGGMKVFRLRRRAAVAGRLHEDIVVAAETIQKLSARAGSPLEIAEVEPVRVRAVIDHLAKRLNEKRLESVAAPIIGDPRQVERLRRAAQALDGTLGSLAAADGGALPLADAARAAARLVQDFGAAVETARQAEIEKAKALAEDEWLRELRAQLDAQERELKKVLDRDRDARARTAAYAARLNGELVPELSRRLGPLAPSRFTDELTPEFAASPSAAVNSFCLVAALIVCPPTAADQRIECTRLLIDPGLGLGDDLQRELAALILETPAAPTLCVFTSALAERFFQTSAPDGSAARLAWAEPDSIAPRAVPASGRVESACPAPEPSPLASVS